ncbi:MAG: hypothetical protein BMS9Abin37_1688 [Acidobacteriota bacterium]|nr:MAG: hypothetical protein BMS9Abin37_1688 [Acidobacteriota bacterium]
MKYMIAWKIPSSSYKSAIEKFLSGGAPVPPGIKTVGRWHVPGSASGWHLVEGDSAEALAQHVAEWAGLIELEVSPVIEDEEAASSLSKLFGK